MAIEVLCECKDGKLSIDVLGAKGKACDDLTKELTESVGKVIATKKKPAYYERKEALNRRVERKN